MFGSVRRRETNNQDGAIRSVGKLGGFTKSATGKVVILLIDTITQAVTGSVRVVLGGSGLPRYNRRFSVSFLMKIVFNIEELNLDLVRKK